MRRLIGANNRSLPELLRARRPGAVDRARSAVTLCISPGCWGSIRADTDDNGEPLDHVGHCERCGLCYRRHSWVEGWTEVVGPVEVQLCAPAAEMTAERNFGADLLVMHGQEFAVAYAGERSPRLVRLTDVAWVRGGHVGDLV
ncbi:MAG: hypothetical protein AB7N61_03740 [Acidimicrobiia bacterium]